MVGVFTQSLGCGLEAGGQPIMLPKDKVFQQGVKNFIPSWAEMVRALKNTLAQTLRVEYYRGLLQLLAY